MSSFLYFDRKGSPGPRVNGAGRRLLKIVSDQHFHRLSPVNQFDPSPQAY